MFALPFGLTMPGTLLRSNILKKRVVDHLLVSSRIWWVAWGSNPDRSFLHGLRVRCITVLPTTHYGGPGRHPIASRTARSFRVSPLDWEAHKKAMEVKCASARKRANRVIARLFANNKW